MADYVGGFDKMLLGIANENQKSRERMLKFNLDKQIYNNKQKNEQQRIKLQQQKNQAEKAYYDRLLNLKAKEAKHKINSRYINNSQGIFDAEEGKWIPIVKQQKQKRYCKSDYGCKSDGTPITANEWGELQAKKRGQKINKQKTLGNMQIK